MLSWLANNRSIRKKTAAQIEKENKLLILLEQNSITQDDMLAIKSLLNDQQVDPNVKQDKLKGDTAIILAVRHGHTDCVDLLIAKNADINAANKDGATALMFAAYDGHIGCLNLLLAENADVNAADNNGATAVILAAQNGHVGCLNSLIAKNADVNAVDNKGGNALMFAAYYGHVDCLNLLLVAENVIADINAISNDGSTALMLAAKRGKDDCLRLLIETGKIAPPSQLGKALQLAAKFGHPECVRLLIEAGADKNYHDWSNPKTSEQLAVKGLHDECICIITGRPYLKTVEDYILKNPKDTKMIIDTLSNWVKRACDTNYIDYITQDILKPTDNVQLLMGRSIVKNKDNKDIGKASYSVDAIADQNGSQLTKLVEYNLKAKVTIGPNSSTLVAIGKEQQLGDAINEINELIAKYDTKKSSLKI